MRRPISFILMLVLGLTAFASLPVTEGNYLHEDSLIWLRLDSIGDRIWKEIDNNPTREDSLMGIYRKAYQKSQEENRSMALRYASVPSGIQRVYMVRDLIAKDTLAALLPTLPDSIRNSYYGKLVDRHINTRQLAIGDSLASFPCQLADGTQFDWKSLDGKNVLVIYSGYRCMGKEGREALKDLYEATSRDTFEIVHYWVEPNNLEALQSEARKIGFKFPIVSDFLRDATPMKIIYGCQGMPTYYFFDSGHRLLLKGMGHEFPWDAMKARLGIKGD